MYCLSVGRWPHPGQCRAGYAGHDLNKNILTSLHIRKSCSSRIFLREDPRVSYSVKSRKFLSLTQYNPNNTIKIQYNKKKHPKILPKTKHFAATLIKQLITANFPQACSGSSEMIEVPTGQKRASGRDEAVAHLSHNRSNGQRRG